MGQDLRAGAPALPGTESLRPDGKVRISEAAPASGAEGTPSDVHAAKSVRARAGARAVERAVAEGLARVDADGDGLLDFDEFERAFGSLADLTAASIATALLRSPDTGFHGIPVVPGGADTSTDAMLDFLVAGAASGLASRALTAPLERIKILSIVQAGAARRSSAWLRFKEMATRAPRELYRGLGPSLLRVVPFAAITGAAYSSSLRWTEHLKPDGALPSDATEATRRFLCASAAGMAAVLGTYPLSVAHTRIAASQGGSRVGLLGTLREVVQRSGPRGLYRAVGPALLVTMPFVGVQQSSYDAIKAACTSAGLQPSLAMFGSSAVASGIIAQSVAHPVDVVRVRTQASDARVASVRATVRSILVKEGVRGFYRGLLPSLSKVAPSVCVSLVVRDALLGRL